MRRLAPWITASIVGIVLTSLLSASCHIGAAPHVFAMHPQCAPAELNVVTPDSREIFRQLPVMMLFPSIPAPLFAVSLVLLLAGTAAVRFRRNRTLRWVWARGAPFAGRSVFIPYLVAVRDM